MCLWDEIGCEIISGELRVTDCNLFQCVSFNSNHPNEIKTGKFNSMPFSSGECNVM